MAFVYDIGYYGLSGFFGSTMMNCKDKINWFTVRTSGFDLSDDIGLDWIWIFDADLSDDIGLDLDS